MEFGATREMFLTTLRYRRNSQANLKQVQKQLVQPISPFCRLFCGGRGRPTIILGGYLGLDAFCSL